MSENGFIELAGTVTSVIYRNEENGYTVLRIKTADGEKTAVGCMPCAAPGEQMELTGIWASHRVHGDQFRVEAAYSSLPETAAGVYEYLASGVIKGIGPATAKLIVERFGTDSLRIIDGAPEQLADLRGITLRRAQDIGEAFRRQLGLRYLVEFLTGYGLSPMLAMKLYVAFGDEARDYVSENPYILSHERFGVEFSSADKMALEMGFEGDSAERVEAAVLFELTHNLGNGHCFLPKGKLAPATMALISVGQEPVEAALDELQNSGEVVCEQVANVEACYLARIWQAENDAASRLADMASRTAQLSPALDTMIQSIGHGQGIVYTELQRRAIEYAATRQLVVLTGGPGTGKTTAVRGIVVFFEQLGLDTALCAPTGRAAKRMTELTGVEAVTIHRLLEAGFSGEGEQTVFGRGASDPLKYGAVILDECSMVDITLMSALLEALPEDCRLILVGDADQLQSVGAGNVFSDIIRSGLAAVVRLNEIFRQAEASEIVTNAHRVNRGENPDLAKNKGDFFFLRRSDSAAADTIVQLCRTRLPDNMGIPATQIQVLTPMRAGETGTVNLNRRLQAALNPGDNGRNEKLFGENMFREGDRVMQTRNNYDIMWTSGYNLTGMGIYNGDIGVIDTIDNARETMDIDFEGRRVVYSFDMLADLELAYALTVHKAQGSEYRAVVLNVGATPRPLLARGVLYTAITRARELLILVGDGETIAQMTANDRQQRRYSGLRARLAALT